MADLVLTDAVDGVAIVSYNRPEKHNALSDALSEQYRSAMDWALSDTSIRTIILRGEGPSFSSGRDVTELGRRPSGEGDYVWVRDSQQLRSRMMTSDKVVIAAVKGYALGGAFESCLASDIRIGASSAQMGLPEITYGILPDTGGTQLLTSLVGPGRAKELVLTGRRIGAEEALAWGILNRVVDDSELDDAVMEVARSIADKAPLARAIGKQLVDQCWADVMHRGLRAEAVAQAMLFTSQDYQEARAARREGRAPNFQGK